MQSQTNMMYAVRVEIAYFPYRMHAMFFMGLVRNKPLIVLSGLILGYGCKNRSNLFDNTNLFLIITGNWNNNKF